MSRLSPGSGRVWVHLARSFAKEGYAVALISRHREPSDPVAAQIRSLNGNVIVDAQIDTPKLRRRDPQRLPDTIIPPDAIADAIWNLDGVVLGPFDPFPAFSGLANRLAASSTPSVLILGQGAFAGPAPCL